MTAEMLIKKVHEEFGPFDIPAEQAVEAAKKILERAQAETALQQAEEKFVGRNIALEEYVALPSEQKHRYFGEAKKLNRSWIEKQLNNLKAKWIMVVNDQVVLHGASLNDYPEDEDFLELCQKIGKYPFVFFSPMVFAIEEQPIAWHKTKAPDDFYPATSITISGYKKPLRAEADLDTGAIDCYSDLELLIKNGIVRIQPQDFEDISEHLSQPYVYLTKHLWLELTDEKGVTRQFRANVICVKDWRNSPFIAINPARTFLLGREVLLELRPRLVLDFDARCTEVQFKMAPS